MSRLLRMLVLIVCVAGVAGAEELVFSSDRDGRNEVWVKRFDQTGLLNLTRGRDYEYAPVWSPDGTTIAYRTGMWRGVSDGHIGLMAANGSGTRRLNRSGGYASGMSWSPDGQWLAYTQMADGRKSRVTTIRADDTEVRSLTGPTAAPGVPAWSPDGKRLVFAGERSGELRVVNSDGTGERVLAQYEETVESPSWSPGGTKLMMVLGKRLAVAEADGTNPVPITDGNGEEAEPAWSPDGRRIMFTATPTPGARARGIYVMDADGRNREQVVVGSALFVSPAWSPDGKAVAFAIIAAGNYDLFAMDTRDCKVKALTATREREGGAVWSPDGRRMVFGVTTGSPAAWLEIMNADGSERTKPQDSGHWAGGPMWTPDGTRILFHRYCCPERGICWTAADGRAEGYLVKEALPGFALSPDGKWLAYALGKDGDAKARLCVARGDGTEPRVLREGVDVGYGSYPSWSPDSREFVLALKREGHYDLWVFPVEGEGARQLTTETGDDTQPAWSPDGGTIAYIRQGKLCLVRPDGTEQRVLVEKAGATGPSWSASGKWLAFTAGEHPNRDVWIVGADGTGLRNVTNDPADDVGAAWRPVVR